MKRADYQVRHIEEGDLASVVSVWRSVWTATYETTLGASALEQMLRDLDENGAAGMIPRTTQGLCLIHEGKIVGTAVHSSGGSDIYLWGMYVAPGHQRSGAGSLMLQMVRKVAGGCPIEIRVLKSSTQAQNFYLKHRFRPTGDEQTEIMPGVTVACVIMRQTA